MRAFQSACVELGIKMKWAAYADDLQIITDDVETAERALWELQAAAALVGLKVNASKTEIMARRVGGKVKKIEDSGREERVTVKWDDGDYLGWKRCISIEENRNRSFQPTHTIHYDDGEIVEYVIKKAGWATDEDGDKHRVKSLGFERNIQGGDQWQCESCLNPYEKRM
ncbi:hypothetical protein Pmar_PMAR021787 [Perkinsus marinus ATCC 50983]|uniref:Reverse transcriptase domain-containing protein n=1 Tax=Perkinsus marinus (strain ATCC 50983 / TXsc) TaxID=423536 RepID=C5LG27_PERM5|nr:hypothetical protein Pmar_PMAR021787 [Perkinsus marinus ATCC 50983]EER04282.1 hypothetical protein Pmar_PMAR021787 [Perkinsus marinus ATCC 50983]|eukprot:XP_002772466.1 hypothetical protein Pmar_PMAR021787 [Perkinsus marinus ATCC 50983]